jgi:hypothetical protein
MALVNVPFTIQTEAEAAQVAARSAAQDQMRRLLTPQAGSGEFAGRFSPVGRVFLSRPEPAAATTPSLSSDSRRAGVAAAQPPMTMINVLTHASAVHIAADSRSRTRLSPVRSRGSRAFMAASIWPLAILCSAPSRHWQAPVAVLPGIAGQSRNGAWQLQQVRVRSGQSKAAFVVPLLLLSAL